MFYTKNLTADDDIDHKSEVGFGRDLLGLYEDYRVLSPLFIFLQSQNFWD
jgi:hypothetical protein